MATAVDQDVVLLETADRVATIILNRPERLNAWTYEMEARFFDLLDQADNDPEVRAIVLTGAGRGFCPGLDADVLSNRSQGGSAPVRTERPLTYALTVRKPLIAAVNGACAGIGLVQALICDLRFTVAGAKFATAFTRRGLVAEFGTSWLLPRLVGYGHATDLLLSGRAVIAEEALAMGLVNRVFPSTAELMAGALDYAKDLAANCSPLAMAEIKRQVAADWYRTRAESEAEAIQLVADPARRPDFSEGVASYVERRPPQFRPLPPKADTTTLTNGR